VSAPTFGEPRYRACVTDTSDMTGPTRLDRPDPRHPTTGPDAVAPARSTAPPVAGATDSGLARSAVSPLEALRVAEILGTRTFCKITIGIGVGAALTVPWLPGHPVSEAMFLVAIALAIVALVVLYRKTREPATFYDGYGVAIGWYVPALSVTSAVPFFGPFSPVAVVLVVGIYFTAAGRNLPVALAVYLTCAIGHGVTGALVIAGWIDPGFVRTDYMPTYLQIVLQLLVQLVLLGAFLIARALRTSSLAALTELERAVRAVAQREALLEEAREELRRAVGTNRGRFTDQTIGHYRLGDVIGRGGMGEVYEAVEIATNASVAVKMLSHRALGDANHVQRFLRELRMAVSLRSPNVVRVIEIGEQPLPHLVMERLRGRDLATILRGNRLLSHGEVVDLIRQVGHGISAAAAAGIVHRDLKPQNVFRDGTTWKILDFGVARTDGASDTLTGGHVVGTPTYMAPEQARGGAVDHRTDLYALAAIAYRVLAGHPPFSGGETVDLLYRVVHDAPRRPTSLATLHGDVDLVLAIGLAKQPADRFATADELARSLEAALAGARLVPVADLLRTQLRDGRVGRIATNARGRQSELFRGQRQHRSVRVVARPRAHRARSRLGAQGRRRDL
jgi:serine/threonine-protein kinase